MNLEGYLNVLNKLSDDRTNSALKTEGIVQRRCIMRHLLLATLALICVPAVLQAEERGPFSQSCLDDHPAPTDRFLVNLCESFAQEPRVKIEERPCDAVCRYPAEKLREDIEAREAGKKAARKAARRIPSIEELDHEIAMMEAFAMNRE